MPTINKRDLEIEARLLRLEQLTISTAMSYLVFIDRVHKRSPLSDLQFMASIDRVSRQMDLLIETTDALQKQKNKESEKNG